MIDVLRHQITDEIGVAVGGRDRLSQTAFPQTRNIVWHDLLREILVQRKQQPLGDAVIFHIHSIAQDHIRHIVRHGKHQIQLRQPFAVFDHLKVNVNVGFFLDLLKKPEVIEICILIFQRILKGGQHDFAVCVACIAVSRRSILFR